MSTEHTQWAVAVTMLKNGGHGIATRLGIWPGSEDEAKGKAVTDALKNNDGYSVGAVTAVPVPSES